MRGLVLAVIFTLLVTYTAKAATDYQCVNDCTHQGYLYQYCVARCSYASPVPAPQPSIQPHGTDYKCVNDCTRNGYMYQYCVQSCSY